LLIVGGVALVGLGRPATVADPEPERVLAQARGRS
jgi:hypothetical protein